ncbi:hypothetical protein QAD02_001654 [Eretmocerus hayati]|uniref:Uncharacterized protein n=1 Tax=Eretmocerus hayati TaxID=131215 RepID=A0ACC2NLG5_9HYME|nr:hypothetical protein QAD02_001654 [Eretmocerus hayati]
MRLLQGKDLFLYSLILLLLSCRTGFGNTVAVNDVKAWSDKLSFELLQLGKYVINIDKFNENYKDVELKIVDGKGLVETIAKNIGAMMKLKINATQRIMDIAESAAETSLTSDSSDEPNSQYVYKDAKNHTQIPTSFNEHFGVPVNLNYSAVHVPTTVYGRAPDTLQAIRWSEELDVIFKRNYKDDPSLSWQYFGSSSGFMRQYPAINWKPNGSNTHDPDLYDCRTRSWYIEAATSPKDVLILVDTSGSMTGMRKEIARHVVNNILDTLGNNDFVNIIKFSNVTEHAVPCFGDTLVQANLANIRELKNGMSEMNTERIADFKLILTYSFDLLKRFRNESLGASCNQAIMLITDGVPDNFKDIFKEWNWEDKENPDLADMPVRMFTYIIGREVADVRDSRWIACANRGYFVHLSTLAEVREQVLNYISVMARPLVLNNGYHPIIWTPVYADVADPKITDWLWDKKERNDQKERYWIYRKNKKLKFLEDELIQYMKKSRKHPSFGDMYKYRLMTSVSMPVFDRRKNATKIANLLGVAGTDIPVDDIKRLMMPYMLGVHGYAFIVTNNGYILTHPDLRPVFQGILKPAYNSVDMAEVELVETDNISRNFSELLIKFRDDIISQSTAHSDCYLHTKYHYDNMKRVGKMKRKYDTAKIDKTPFTVVVSLPRYGISDTIYGVHAKLDVKRMNLDEEMSASKFFKGKNWRIHPDWWYCKYHFDNAYHFATPEEEFSHFLSKIGQPYWKWGTMPFEQSQPSKNGDDNPDPRHYCDRDLVSNLLFDAERTEWFADPKTSRNEKGSLARLMKLLSREQFHERFGYTLAFVATRSGLTRWQDFPPREPKEGDREPPPKHFSRLYPKAIDEVWYKRAVEQHYVSPGSFVFSIPIDEDGSTNSTLVTASQAIFVGNESMKAPAAVVGFQMTHKALQGLFKNITFSCKETNCKTHCGDENIDCYLVDNHGYVVAAKDQTDAGRFLGEVNGLVMRKLIDRGVYEKISVFDYQGVCFRNTQETSDGSILSTPLKTLTVACSWLYAQIAWSLAMVGLWSDEYAEAVAYPNDSEMKLHTITESDDATMVPESMKDINDKPAAEIKDDQIYDTFVRITRTRPEPCDRTVELFLLRNITAANAVYDNHKENIEGCDHMKYIVQPVKSTNLVLLMIDTQGCRHVTYKISVESEELEYTSNNSLACRKLLNNLPRTRPTDCIRMHREEFTIKDLCGSATLNTPKPALILMPSIILALLFVIHVQKQQR